MEVVQHTNFLNGDSQTVPMPYHSVLATLIISTLLLAFGCSPAEEETPTAVPPDAVQQPEPTVPETAELAAVLPKSEPAAETQAKPHANAGKEWTDPAGNVLAVGEFVSLMDDKVCLETPDGLGTVVPLASLCDADRKLVQTKPDADLTVEEEPEEVVEEMVEQILPTASEPVDAEYAPQKVVIPFDFISNFDDGRYGSKIGDMIVKKIQKQGTFAVPDAIDIRDLCAQQDVKIAPDTPLKDIHRVLRDLFDAQIAVWGSCEKVPGHEWEVYDLTIKCADFSESLEPKMLYDVAVRTKSVSEIPHLYVAEMLDKLHGREPGGPTPLNPIAEQNWIDNPNLAKNGTFEAGSRGVPLGWDDRGGQEREPLGNLVQWTTEAGNPSNRVVRFTFDKGVGDGFGVMYYSKPFPIEEDATYRSHVRYRSNGPKIIVFIKCYAEVPDEYRATDGISTVTNHTTIPGKPEYVPEIGHARECYRSQQNMKGAKNQWNTRIEDFTPKHTRFSPQWGRVMLYSYVGAGVVEFDDIAVKQILPASASDSRGERRHSQDSAVTIKEMEENERRAREAQEPRKQ